jgi:hypothetical protein
MAKAKSPSGVDCRGHALVVYDGQTRCGTLTEGGGEFCAFDLNGVCLGAFPTMLRAARALPTAEPAP